MAAKNELGSRFGLLLVVEKAENKPDGSAAWLCACDCGESRIVAGTGLRAGRHKSCGCASPRFTNERLTTHGFSKDRVYSIWHGMKARCSDVSEGKSRKLYFEKGIRVCDRWMSFETFLSDMGMPLDHQSIDRIDGSKGYEPSNCRWATDQEQANNTSSNVFVEHEGKTMTVADWARSLGMKSNTLLYRLRRGTPVDQALQAEFISPRVARSQKSAKDRARVCAVCEAPFVPRPAQLAMGYGKFCSQACNGASRIKNPAH